MLTLFSLNSCIQVESTITLKKDGSGTITENLLLGAQMMQMMEMMGAQAAQAGGKAKDPMAEMMDENKAIERAKEMGEGVEFVSIEKISADGKLGVKTIFKFSDINKLSYNSAGAMDMGDKGKGPKAKSDGNKPVFKYADGKLTIVQKLPKGDKDDKEADVETDKKDDAMDEQSMAMMQGMMKDMRMSMKIKFEPGIAKTNATYVDGDTITIVDLEFGKIVSDPKKLKALQGGDFEKTKKALKGIDGIKFEAQDTVEVELK